jgi:hypothetical protein
LSAFATSWIVGNPFTGTPLFATLPHRRYANACDARATRLPLLKNDESRSERRRNVWPNRRSPLVVSKGPLGSPGKKHRKDKVDLQRFRVYQTISFRTGVFGFPHSGKTGVIGMWPKSSRRKFPHLGVTNEARFSRIF